MYIWALFEPWEIGMSKPKNCISIVLAGEMKKGVSNLIISENGAVSRVWLEGDASAAHDDDLPDYAHADPGTRGFGGEEVQIKFFGMFHFSQKWNINIIHNVSFAFLATLV